MNELSEFLDGVTEPDVERQLRTLGFGAAYDVRTRYQRIKKMDGWVDERKISQ